MRIYWNNESAWGARTEGAPRLVESLGREFNGFRRDCGSLLDEKGSPCTAGSWGGEFWQGCTAFSSLDDIETESLTRVISPMSLRRDWASSPPNTQLKYSRYTVVAL